MKLVVSSPVERMNIASIPNNFWASRTKAGTRGKTKTKINSLKVALCLR